MPRPLRSSCDRCHSQKLKCPKQSGFATCSRCLKAGTSCVFSPAGLSSRRNMLTPVYLASDLNMNMQFDWPSLNLENSLETPPDTTQEELQPNLAQLAGQAEADPASQDPRSNCVRQLTSLAVEVDRISQDLSSISRVHVSKNRPIREYHAKFTENNAHHLCVEQLFTQAQRLIDIYPQVLKILFDKPDTSKCQDLNCFHTVELPDELAELFIGIDDDQDEIDVFLFNILVSCHTKVVNTMGIVVSCARTCSQVTLASPSLDEPGVQISEVRVGNFVATNSSASIMQTVLLIHFAEVLVDYAQQLNKRITNIVECETNNKQVGMLKLQCELLEEKAVSKMKLLTRVKNMFTILGCIK
ncbi:hypothetical protein F4804DRAFT_344426 [Jackrogersella minutella]|nr:hypothetical protein F4804DRAFT_344426 [Jackrogersella minutella]